ncbi:MAG TPA: dephospho-CoA kinase [Candidatus Acidoferrales bacterium]|jgi:dephospho-CoA kinase|nr:dephospho-CoA kinase [Candidatus Acidoferrales bacterium]
MLRAGLTGGIGCGKSTVAAMMRELGCRVLDADALARDLAEPDQPAYQEIVQTFGKEILSPDGRIDRSRLAHLVFSDASKLVKLNTILHPRVIAEQQRQLAEIARTDPMAVAVVEAALLVEAGYQKFLDRLIVVWCRPDQQLERLTMQGGRAMSREDAQRRIASQMPVDEKRRAATDEINNSGSIEETRAQVAALVGRLKQMAAAGTNESVTGGTKP